MMQTLRRVQRYALSTRSLLILAGAEVVSDLGNWIATMAIFEVVIFRNGGGVIESTGVFVAGRIPGLLLAPLAGSLCDRFDRRTLMIGSRLGGAAAIAGLIFVESVVGLYAFLALSAAFASILGPARQTVVRDLVPAGDLTRANALLEQFASMTKMVGPVVGGVLLFVVSPNAAISLNVVALIIAAGLLFLLPPLPSHMRGNSARAPVPELEPSLGVRNVIQGYPKIGILMSLTFLLTFVIVATDVSLAVFVRDYLDAGIEFNGVLTGLVGLGTLLAAIGLMLGRGTRNTWRDTLLGFGVHAAVPAGLALAAIVPSHGMGRGIAAVGYLVCGLGAGLSQIQGSTFLQRTVPRERLGQIQGIMQSLATGGQLAGLLVTPLFVPRWLSLPNYFAVSALIVVALNVCAFVCFDRRAVPSPEAPQGPLQS